MTWSPLSAPSAKETFKTRWRAVPWTAGKGLDLGCGAEKLFETQFVTGIDNGHDQENFGLNVTANVFGDARELPFSAGTQDYVFSSFLLQYFHYTDVPAILRDWMRVLKVGACMVLYLPDEDQYPKCAEPERGIAAEPQFHPAQKWNVSYNRLVEALVKSGTNFDLCHFEQCAQHDEYALFFVIRKLK